MRILLKVFFIAPPSFAVRNNPQMTFLGCVWPQFKDWVLPCFYATNHHCLSIFRMINGGDGNFYLCSGRIGASMVMTVWEKDAAIMRILIWLKVFQIPILMFQNSPASVWAWVMSNVATSTKILMALLIIGSNEVFMYWLGVSVIDWYDLLNRHVPPLKIRVCYWSN